MTKKLIIFDFDGVIADSFDYCLRTNQSIHSNLTEEKYKQWFEGNFYDAHKKTVGKDMTKYYKDTYWERFIKDLDQILLVKDMDRVLANLAKKNNLTIISSATSDVIKNIMSKEKIDNYFTEIYGSDIAESKVEKFNMVFEKFKVNPSDSLFITDTLGDLIEAEKSGIASIAVSWGFHEPNTLKRGKYYTIVDTPAELLNEVNNYFQGTQDNLI